MRHLTIVEFGTFVGVTGARLTVRDADGGLWETPLSRLRSVKIAKAGVSLSSNVIFECAARGIRLYFVDWRGTSVAAVSPTNNHATVKVRQGQFECIKDVRSFDLCREIILCKIKNQRSVLLYYRKYLIKKDPSASSVLLDAAESIKSICVSIKEMRCTGRSCHDLKTELMGFEGFAARVYWRSLRETALVPKSFSGREGRGSVEITNAALNYGYAILSSHVWSALENAGLELFAGLLHQNRPGKPSLVLDLMEEYRAFVVDKNIIKLRSKLAEEKELTKELKAEIASAIDDAMTSQILWKGKQVRLENVLQRQAYRLAGAMASVGTKYKGLTFKW